MTAIAAYADLLRYGKPVVSTREVAVRLSLTTAGASKLLARLTRAGLVVPVRRGLYSLARDLDPLVLPEYLSFPLPSYVSLLTALHVHGLIEQIPRRIFVASLAPSRRIATHFGVFSIHHLAPEVFGGFEEQGSSGVKLARPEKALFDVLYLSRAKSRLFARLPELELPDRFDGDAARRWVERIKGRSHREMVRARLEAILKVWQRRGAPPQGPSAPSLPSPATR